MDKKNQPVTNVNITYLGNSAQTNAKGFYQISIPVNQKVTIIFTHIALKKATLFLTLNENEEQEFNLVMSDQLEQMGEIIVTTNNKRRIQGITTIEPEMLKRIPGVEWMRME